MQVRSSGLGLGVAGRRAGHARFLFSGGELVGSLPGVFFRELWEDLKPNSGPGFYPPPMVFAAGGSPQFCPPGLEESIGMLNVWGSLP